MLSNLIQSKDRSAQIDLCALWTALFISRYYILCNLNSRCNTSGNLISRLRCKLHFDKIIFATHRRVSDKPWSRFSHNFYSMHFSATSPRIKWLSDAYVCVYVYAWLSRSQKLAVCGVATSSWMRLRMDLDTVCKTWILCRMHARVLFRIEAILLIRAHTFLSQSFTIRDFLY